MGIEDGDTKPNAKLLLIANAVLSFVDDYCNRQLEAQRYLLDPRWSYFDGTGSKYIYMPQYPLCYVSSINVDSSRVFGAGTIIASSSYFFYPSSGKIEVDQTSLTGGYWTRGRRNVLIDYTAGFAPVVGGTWNSSVSTYPIPGDLKQVMIEMCVESFKEGITAVHTTVNPQTGDSKMTNMITKNSWWTNVLSSYKSFDQELPDRDENQTRSKFDYNAWS